MQVSDESWFKLSQENEIMIISQYTVNCKKRGFRNDRHTVLENNTCVDLSLILFTVDKESTFADKF